MTASTGESAEEKIVQRKRQVAAFNAAATRRANDEAEFISSEAALMASAPFTNSDGCCSAALPRTGRGRSMVEAQSYRVNFYGLPVDELCRFARVQARRNWFARPVIKKNMEIFGDGFRVVGEGVDEWLHNERTGLPRYPFRRVHDDALREWLTTSNIVAFWKKRKPGQPSLPYVEILSTENCRVETVGGVKVLKVFYNHRRQSVGKTLAGSLGPRLTACLRHGKTLEIVQGTDADFDFAALSDDKDNCGLSVPSITTVQDDLEFIEAVRAGDWTGAWRRRVTIMHVKKGYGIQSGTNAGAVRTHAKRKQLKAISDWLKNLKGHGNAATNFDQEFEHVVFPKDFFGSDIVAGALNRLMIWGGFAAVLLLKSESQISGVSPYLMLQLRADAINFRERFADFLKRIFNSPSFRGDQDEGEGSIPVFEFQWSNRLLYTFEELVKQGEALRKGGASMRTLRERTGLDHEEESKRTKAEASDPGSVIPVFEFQQGLSSAFYTTIYPGKTGSPASEPGSPGRPTDQT